MFNTRNNIKKLFNAPSEENVVFTPNVTYALNMVFLGILKPNDHVITTSMEHNSVIRPLRYLEKSRKIDLTIVKCDIKGQLDPMDIKRAIRKNTKIIVMTHASNITGGIAPIEHISKLKEETGAYFVLDCAQTAGVLDIDFKKLQLDFLAFTGHKGLYGPPGTGGLILSDIAADEIVPLIHGGTGSKSDMEYQPDFMPDKMEAGTPNTIGIAGLYAGLNFVNEKGIKTIREHQTKLTKIFMEGLKSFPELEVFGQEEPDKRVAWFQSMCEVRT